MEILVLLVVTKKYTNNGYNSICHSNNVLHRTVKLQLNTDVFAMLYLHVIFISSAKVPEKEKTALTVMCSNFFGIPFQSFLKRKHKNRDRKKYCDSQLL